MSNNVKATFEEIKRYKAEHIEKTTRIKDEADRREKELSVSIDASKKMMDAAMENGDDETYLKAKKAYDEASIRMEAAKRRHEKASGPIPEEEYRKLVESIKKEIDDYKNETAHIIIPLIDQLYTAGKDLERKANEAQDFLTYVQHNLYKDTDRVKTKDGWLYGQDAQKVSKEVWEMVRLATLIKDQPIFGILKEQGFI